MKIMEKAKRFFTLNANHTGGFTLVELIVVIAILAILAGVAVPAYSGYIEKSKRAGDETLLAAVNKAYAAACVAGGSDVYLVTNASAPFTSDNAIDVDNVEPYGEEFALFYEGNENAQFQVITGIVFDAGLHMFVDPATATSLTLGYGANGTIVVSGTSLQALKNSAFTTEMTSGELLGQIDYVTTLAASLMEDADSTFAQLISGAEYGQILADTLNVTYGSEEFVSSVKTMLNDKMDALIASGQFDESADTSEGSELYNTALNQIYANNAVMYAAQNSSAVSDDILTVLGGTNSKSQIVSTINGNSGEGLAQAAMAYGLYTAYAERNGLTVSSNPVDVLSAIDGDQGFKDYINNEDGNGYAETDLAGYLASMDMINTNTSTNKDAVSDILVNGFANENLVELLTQASK